MSGQSARLASRRVEISADVWVSREEVRTIARLAARRWRDSQQTSFPDFSTEAMEYSRTGSLENLELARLKMFFS